MNDITIRKAVAADVPTIAALILMGKSSDAPTRQEAEREARHPSYAEAFTAIDASHHDLLLVAEQGGRVVATCQLTLIPGLAERGRLRGKLESVHTDPDCRGQGIGAKLVRHAIKEAKARGVVLLELSSNKSRLDAHRFYRNLGFAQSHEGFKLQL